MSFGGTVTRGKRGATGSGLGTAGARRPVSTGAGPASAMRDEGEIDWERVAVFGTGIALGVALGAGVALLFAPSTGEETRAAILRRGTRLAHQGRDVWEDLRDELQWATRRGKRRLGRRVQRVRWAAEDFMDERRRPERWRGKGRPEPSAKDREPEAAEIDERNVQEIVDALC